MWHMLRKRFKSSIEIKKIMNGFENEDKKKLALRTGISFWLLVFGIMCISSCATPKKHLIRPIPRPSSNLRNY